MCRTAATTVMSKHLRQQVLQSIRALMLPYFHQRGQISEIVTQIVTHYILWRLDCKYDKASPKEILVTLITCLKYDEQHSTFQKLSLEFDRALSILKWFYFDTVHVIEDETIQQDMLAILSWLELF